MVGLVPTTHPSACAEASGEVGPRDKPEDDTCGVEAVVTKYWFRPKRFGYGATPVTWEGWVSTSVFAAGLVWAMLEFTRTIELARTGAVAASMIAVYVALVAAAIWGFVRFSRYKTSGEWKWRWGGE